MPNKINLITPPDELHNNNFSINLININSEEQQTVSIFLGRQTDERDVNVYAYNNENNPSWLLNRINGKTYTYINLDNCTDTSVQYISYMLSMNNVYYATNDVNKKELYSLITTNYISNVNDFLKKVYNEQ